MNIREVLETLNIEYIEEGHEHARPGWIQTDCPKCDTLGNEYYRLGWNLAHGYCSCWCCGGISNTWALCQMSGQSFPKVQKLLSGMIGDFTKDRPSGKLVLPEGIKPMTPRHRHYLKKRGFDPDEMEKVWHLQGIGMASKLSWRLFIPITLKGKMVSWTTRSLDPQMRMKYIGASSECESIPKHNLLYGEDYASPHSVICVEGPADVWAIGPGAVATLGIAYSQSQLLKLSRYTNRYIVYDAEDRAQEKARQLCSDLKVFSGNTYNVVMDSKDPGEASRKEINQLRRLLK